MSKRISDLNEAIANRARRSAQSGQTDRQRPRLAERLVALAPLARAPLVPDADAADAPAAGLSRLADAPRFRHRASSRAQALGNNALVPRSGSPLPARASTPLSRVAGQATVFADPDTVPPSNPRRATVGFLAGLSIAAAIGVALYAFLV